MANCPLNGAFSGMSWLLGSAYSPFAAQSQTEIGAPLRALSIPCPDQTASADGPIDLFSPGAIPLGYLYSSLVQHAMRRMAAAQGVENRAVFGTLLRLATDDPWEETAAVAYEILSAQGPYRAQLTGALANFASPYYREKARFHLARAGGEETVRIEGLLSVLLGDERGLSEIRRRHEEVFLGRLRLPAGGEDAAAEGGAEDLDAPDVYTVAGIKAWAGRCVDAMRGEGETRPDDSQMGTRAVPPVDAAGQSDSDDDADDAPPPDDAAEDAEMKRQARADRTIKIIDDLLARLDAGDEAREFKERRAHLIDPALTVEELEKKARKLHAEILAHETGFSIHKTRAHALAEARKSLDGQVMPRLSAAKSHFIAADYFLRRSAAARAKAAEVSLGKLLPELREFNSLNSEVTDEKKAVAARLGIAGGWEDIAGQKAIVEIELLAEFAGLSSELRESYFAGIREEMMRSAEAEEERFKELISPGGRRSLGRFRIRHVPKTDIYTWVRIGDFRPCCIATDGFMYFPHVPHYLLDRMTQALVIEDPDAAKAAGHMIHHLGLAGSDLEPAMFLNALYFRTQYRGAEQDSSALGVMHEYAGDAGAAVVRHGINEFHDLTTRPPEGYYSSANVEIVRLQTLVDSGGKPATMYGDLNIPREGGNETHKGTAHYQRRVR